MSNGTSQPVLQVTIQRTAAQWVIAERAIIGGDPRGVDARMSVVFGLIVRAVRASAWLRSTAKVFRRGFTAFIRFWNIPVLGADETQESHYLQTGRLN